MEYYHTKREKIIDVIERTSNKPPHGNMILISAKTKHGYVPLIWAQLEPPWRTTFPINEHSPHLYKHLEGNWNTEWLELDALRHELIGRYVTYKRENN
jgi:hypothetical protein